MESTFERQRWAIRLVGDGISLITEGLHLLRAEGDQADTDSRLREGLRQLVLSQLPTQPSAMCEPEATGSGPNFCESETHASVLAPPPLQVPVAEQLAGFVPNYKSSPRPYLRPNLTEPEAGPHREPKPEPKPERGPQQEPPAMTPPQREITSSPPQREITSSHFEGIRIKLRHRLSQRDRGESN